MKKIRQFYEIMDAKEKMKEMNLSLEKLLEEHKKLSPMNREKMLKQTDKALVFMQEKFRQLIEDMENHKKRIQLI